MSNLSLGLTPQIIDACKARSLTVPMTAYVLATGFWESGRTMQPVEEAYYLGAKAEAFRRRLRYYPWFGRGLVQLTWEFNYLKAGQVLDVDLITDPDRALDPDISVAILVQGMVEGWFTGRKLADYFGAGRTDYVGARRMINGTDCAAQIADIAIDYEHDLTPAPAYPAIRRGSRGAVVREAQVLLTAQGYSVGAIDGIFGPATHKAALAFQRSAGLTVDGIIGPATWAALVPEIAGA